MSRGPPADCPVRLCAQRRPLPDGRWILLNRAGDRVTVLSAGSEPADQVNPAAVTVMAEDGIDIATTRPKQLTDAAVERADVVVTMGCGDACPFFPGKRYEDWKLDDPAGQELDSVRRIRDEIKQHVNDLIGFLDVAT